MVAMAQDVKRARQVKAPPVPASINELTRDGLLHLLRSVHVDRHALFSARAHELDKACDAASEAWRQALARKEAAFNAYLATPNEGTPHAMRKRAEAQLAHARADEAERRAWSASMKADAVASAFGRAYFRSEASE